MTKLSLVALSLALLVPCTVEPGHSKAKLIPIHKESTWPIDVSSDLEMYSKYLIKRDSGKARSLRQAANRLNAARMLYPEYPRIKKSIKDKRYRNCLPSLQDLKLLKKASQTYHLKSPDKALYSAIYCMRLIGRGSERYWKVAPVGSLKESKKIIEEAESVLNENVGKRDPARIPVLLASAYYHLHSGQTKEAERIAREAIETAKTKFGSGSRQIVSTIKYASLIFHSTKKYDEFSRLLKYHRKIAIDKKTRLTTKADFYY